MRNYLAIITGLFVAVLCISNVASTKIVQLGPLAFDGGTLLFPLSYIFGDILTEVYGYQQSRRVIWTGFVSLALMAGVFIIVGKLPPASGWELQSSYESILLTTPRIVAASLIAYFAGEFANSAILSRMKVWTQGRWLWTRTIGSTLVGEMVDTLIFVTIAFYGTLPGELLVVVLFSNYAFKVGVEVVATPLTYYLTGMLKRAEGIDTYDWQVNYNPFSF
ncbi:MAG: queuosine precursor transporter [Firmicutes bacterium]|nr:queuosine precursor transporter [Bacillota bacterium]